MKACTKTRPSVLFTWTASVLLFGGLMASGTDWPQYRGANHDGVSSDRITVKWPVEGPTQLWRIPCTNGLASFAVTGGRAYTQIKRNDGTRDQELCIALDAATGAELWASTVEPARYDSGVGSDDGPRSTPTIQNGRVYVLSSHLVLHCFDATNGTPVWRKDLVALYGAKVIAWQNAASPLVDGDLIFVNGSTDTNSLFAFRTQDGSLAWRSQRAAMTQSTPVVAKILGVPQVIFATQDRLVSLNRSDGSLLWESRYPFTYTTSLAASPVVYSNLVFISANYTMGAYAVGISMSNSALVATPAWTNIAYRAHWMTPVCHQGYLYGMFGSAPTSPLMCIDLKTGVQKWSMSGFGRGGTILVDNRLVALAERGDLVVIDPNPAAYTELARFTLFPNYDPDANKCWNVAAVCDGRIYARSTAEAACLDVAVSTLKMLPPRIEVGNGLQLWIGTDTGAAIDAERLAKIQLRWSTNLALPLSEWGVLPNSLVLTNGQVCVDHVPGTESAFYVATETP